MAADKKLSLKNILSSKEIKKKIFFSFLIIAIFRFLASVPVIGMTVEAMETLLNQYATSDAFQIFSSGGLETASVIAIGIGPYISASIMLQLMGSVIPKLEELRKEGSEGQRKISTYTRIVTVPLAILQSFVIYGTLQGLVPDMQPLSAFELAGFVATLTAGAMIIMWIAEKIGEDGLANGSSYLIFLGILSGVLSKITSNLASADALEILAFTVVGILIIASVVLVTDAERRIKLLYSRRVGAGGGQENYLPIKITQFGVMPVIFASALLTFPIYIGSFVTASENMPENVVIWTQGMIDFLQNNLVQDLGTFFMVLAFSFFYISVVFKTDEVAENLQKQGAFIPGIRPGAQTEKFLRQTSYRLTAFGGLFLAILAVLPQIFYQTGMINSTIMSGTGLLIVIGVALDMRRKIESMVVVRNYDRYL
jgi:preprotein translocase subunit SecY